MACSLRSHTLHQYMSLQNSLASALHMMSEGFGMICLMMYTQLNLPLHSENKLKTYLFAKAYSLKFSGLVLVFLYDADPLQYLWLNDYGSLLVLFTVSVCH